MRNVPKDYGTKPPYSYKKNYEISWDGRYLRKSSRGFVSKSLGVKPLGEKGVPKTAVRAEVRGKTFPLNPETKDGEDFPYYRKVKSLQRRTRSHPLCNFPGEIFYQTSPVND